MNENRLQEIISYAKEYGFIFQSSEIYDGLGAVYDYGQYGVELKRNIQDFWWKHMTQYHDNIVGLDSSIFMHDTVWKASGHIDSFTDLMIDNLDSKKRYRVDHLIENHVDSYDNKEDILSTMELLMKNDDYSSLKSLILDLGILCEISKTNNWSDVRLFNLMFSTEVGSVVSETNTIYLRPETAQGIFVNFLNVQKSGRMKIPFGIAQVGKAFRNEIVSRGFIFRMREFTQMEMQFFIRPGTQKEWYEYWKNMRLKWHSLLGVHKDNSQLKDHVKLAFYADMACDIEYNFPMGFKEVEGIHSRTDYDLSKHQEYSKKKMNYYDSDINPDTNKPYGNYIPYVIETSIGLDRAFLMVLNEAYNVEQDRIVLKINPKLAPIKIGIFPLTKNAELVQVAKSLMDDCRLEHKCFYEEKDSIGKRYRRMDAIGTPYCITVDFQTLEDNTVTIRYRDDMKQERILLSDVIKLRY